MRGSRLVLILLFFASLAAKAKDESANGSPIPPAVEAPSLPSHWIRNQKTSEIRLGLEVAQIQTPGASFTGYGLAIADQLSLNENWAVTPKMAQVMSSSNYLYTSLGAQLSYALTGSFRWGTNEVDWNGRPIVTIDSPRRAMWTAGFGAEQLLLNGSDGVYPAPGMFFSLGRTLKFNSSWYDLTIRSGTYTSNEKSVTALMVNLSVPLNF